MVIMTSMTMFSISEQIDRLKQDVLNGELPTWYAYQEIDRLENMMRGKQDG